MEYDKKVTKNADDSIENIFESAYMLFPRQETFSICGISTSPIDISKQICLSVEIAQRISFCTITSTYYHMS